MPKAACRTVIALGLALLIDRVARSKIIRSALLHRFLVTNVIVALLDYQLGTVNEVVSWPGLPRIAFFGSEQWAIPTISFVTVSLPHGLHSAADLRRAPGHPKIEPFAFGG